MPARLTIHDPTRPARVVLLREGRCPTVGRDAACDVVLDDDRVSRCHARFSEREGSWSLVDLESKNGTWIDGAVPDGSPLGSQCWLSFGGVIASFEVLDDGAGERDLARLTTALELGRGLDPAEGLDRLLPRVVGSMLELTEAERGYVLLAGEDGTLEIAARSPESSAGTSCETICPPGLRGFTGSLGAVWQALESGEPVVSADARADVHLGERASVVGAEIRALLCVPVQALERRLGVLYADSRKAGAAFTGLDLEILQALASQAGLAIALARLDRELKALARRLTEHPESDPALLARLAGEVSAIWERSLATAQSEGAAAGGSPAAAGSFR